MYYVTKWKLTDEFGDQLADRTVGEHQVTT
jgi:hypothetical protein